MSGQIIELIIFAAIAFFIINKLISTLGTTNDEDGGKTGFFGEDLGIKDVTPKRSASEHKMFSAITGNPFGKKNKSDIDSSIILSENRDSIISGIEEITSKMPSFKPDNFIKGAKVAFRMILSQPDEQELAELVDKRYLDHFKSILPNYGKYIEGAQTELEAKFSELYMFGNNIFIKVLFSGKNVTDKIRNLHEEWTFTRSANVTSSNWYLANIDRPS